MSEASKAYQRKRLQSILGDIGDMGTIESARLEARRQRDPNWQAMLADPEWGRLEG